ncbi:SUR7/PalI family-domain-containing protein [Coniochaeta sp. 2T2.1]|nr:SUR7/PalI family-domain-containing protein [Coniochaeta sp. 2T2.1]
MAVARPSISLVALVLLAGSLVLLWFVILSGVVHSTPLDKTYFLRADTLGITGARPISQWTYFYVCGDGNTDCGKAAPDPPFGHAWDSNPANAPEELVGGHGGDTTSSKYFFMWRFGWVFYLLALFFSTVTFFTGFLACFGRLGAALSGLMSIISLVIYTVGVSLMTATFVLARDAFRRDGREATIGRWAFGFSWASWFCLLLASILFCLAMGRGGDRNAGVATGGRTWGRRRHSTRSRMSYDVGGGRRVKDEYS